MEQHSLTFDVRFDYGVKIFNFATTPYTGGWYAYHITIDNKNVGQLIRYSNGWRFFWDIPQFGFTAVENDLIVERILEDLTRYGIELEF